MLLAAEAAVTVIMGSLPKSLSFGAKKSAEVTNIFAKSNRFPIPLARIQLNSALKNPLVALFGPTPNLSCRSRRIQKL